MAAAFQAGGFEGREWRESIAREIPVPDLVELGSLTASLAEETEDEFELDLRVRAFVESGCVHVLQRVGPHDADSRIETTLLGN